MCLKRICRVLGCWGSSGANSARTDHTCAERTAFPGIQSHQRIPGTGHTALPVRSYYTTFPSGCCAYGLLFSALSRFLLVDGYLLYFCLWLNSSTAVCVDALRCPSGRGVGTETAPKNFAIFCMLSSYSINDVSVVLLLLWILSISLRLLFVHCGAPPCVCLWFDFSTVACVDMPLWSSG